MQKKSFRSGRGWRLGAYCALAMALCACGPAEPLRIGFVGGLSGRVADLGISGRNGAMVAIDMRNQAGGIKGRQIELLAEDDQQDTEVAKAAVGRLLARKPVAIVGPMTSAMAVAVVPQANAAGVLMISPTVTTNALSGIDDMFVRVVAPTTDHAKKGANSHVALGWRRVIAVVDQRNAAYSESWLQDYRSAFTAAGGSVVDTLRFTSSETEQFGELARKLATAPADGVLIIANSVDTAMLAQQLRKLNPKLPMSTSEWAATERLTELGGKAVEGMIVAQFVDRESTAPAYVAFRKTYRERFGQEPGFGGLAAFDATNVVLDALAGQADGQTLKQAVLARQTFNGAQSEIRFDAAGDTFRETFLTTVRNGSFVRLR